MNENEFEHDGKVYAASASENWCKNCAFELESPEYCDSRIPACSSWERKDNRNVIFIEKQGE